MMKIDSLVFYYHLRNFKKHGFEKRPFKVCGREKKNLLKGDVKGDTKDLFHNFEN